MMRKRETKKPEDIKGIICKVVTKIERRGIGKKEKALVVWHKIVGEKAASHSRPVNIKRGVLTIEVDSSTWLYEFSLRKKAILKETEKELKAEGVKDIKFRMGDVA